MSAGQIPTLLASARKPLTRNGSAEGLRTDWRRIREDLEKLPDRKSLRKYAQLIDLAERVGFEPTVRQAAQQISSPGFNSPHINALASLDFYNSRLASASLPSRPVCSGWFCRRSLASAPTRPSERFRSLQSSEAAVERAERKMPRLARGLEHQTV